MSPFPQPLDITPIGLPLRLGQSALDLTPFGAPIRVAGQIFDYFEDKEKAGMKKIIDDKPHIYDPKTNTFVPDTSTPEAAAAWRKRGTKSTLGQKPVVWDDVIKDWIPDFSVQPTTAASAGAPPAPPVDLGTPPAAPVLPEPLAKPPSTDFGASKDSPLEGQKADFTLQDLLGFSERLIRDYQIPMREAESQREIQRSIVTAALRDRGLKELSRRQIETENIKAWRDLQVAREQARAAQAISLANTAYLAQIPNTGVMEAMNNAMKGAMQQIAIQAPNVPAGRNLFG
jgi:hypothetical protein